MRNCHFLFNNGLSAAKYATLQLLLCPEFIGVVEVTNRVLEFVFSCLITVYVLRNTQHYSYFLCPESIGVAEVINKEYENLSFPV